MSRRAIVPQRRPIFIGCEGKSESGYAGVLQELCNQAGLHLHVVIFELAPGAGDPLDRINMAVRRLNILRRTRTAPADRFVLLDRDQADADPQRTQRTERIAADNGIHIVWQRPCFEALLLRHLPGRAGHRPVDTATAISNLEHDWPGFTKGMNRIELAHRIDRAAVERASVVEPDLKILLDCLGLFGGES